MSEQDQAIYSRRYLAFVRRHEEEFRTAYEAPSPSTSRSQMARLQREYQTLPPRHLCSCPRVNHWPVCNRSGRCQCPNTPTYHCAECERASQAILRQDYGAEVSSRRPRSSGSVPGPIVILDMEAGYAA
jgi:hypothetical protein